MPSEGGGGSCDGRAPSYQWLKIDILGHVTPVKVNSSGKLLDSYVATDPDNKHKLELNKGTKITCTSGKVPRSIEMDVRAPAKENKANIEVITTIAGFFDVPLNDVLVVSGIKNKKKKLLLKGKNINLISEKLSESLNGL